MAVYGYRFGGVNQVRPVLSYLKRTLHPLKE